MKYQFLLTAFFFLLTKSEAQFLLKPGGFAAADGKGYYVIEVPGASRQQLFEAVERRISTSFGSFRDRISTDPDKEIVFQATERGGLNYYGKDYDITFQASFEFRDGRIKVNAPVIRNIRSFNPRIDSAATVLAVKSPGTVIFLNRSYFVYDKKGKLKNRPLKEMLETLFNEEILAPLLAVNANEDW
ncbi:hypothetical protein [Niabella beijingensis]|uniref:hypothetical protein n=1 Tax=Niabella beijingensis TaxID=2872700 RepID=UPI001CBE4082|nr:hypothetical protein [Niabella beijingensis]MBZ4189536.1 hypothetical protein [Niabella beijingensis]